MCVDFTTDLVKGIMAVKLAFYPPLTELLLATADLQLWDASDPEVCPAVE